jgi:NADH-quinone oxidoreductase subunit E
MLGVPLNQVTDDGLFSVESVRCIGCCGLAPVLVAGGEVFGKLTKESIPDIVAKLKEKG